MRKTTSVGVASVLAYIFFLNGLPTTEAEVDIQSDPYYRCPMACTKHYMPFCASNGRTYGNFCELKKAQCRDNTIKLVHRGRCGGGIILYDEDITTFNLAGSVWDWYHDGINKNGRITLTRDGKVKWKDGAPHGSWSVDNDILTTTFNGIFHRIKIDGSFGIVLEPKRSPPSKMIRHATSNLAGSVWDWYHDGINRNGGITLTRDGKVKWNDGTPQGSWSVDNDILTTTFNGIFHRIKIDGSFGIVLEPRRSPPSKMIRHGCATTMCLMHCPHGFDIGENGCQMCQCKQAKLHVIEEPW